MGECRQQIIGEQFAGKTNIQEHTHTHTHTGTKKVTHTHTRTQGQRHKKVFWGFHRNKRIQRQRGTESEMVIILTTKGRAETEEAQQRTTNLLIRQDVEVAIFGVNGGQQGNELGAEAAARSIRGALDEDHDGLLVDQAFQPTGVSVRIDLELDCARGTTVR